jgi:hypothetical protein
MENQAEEDSSAKRNFERSDNLMRSEYEQHAVAMARLLLLTGVILLMPDCSFAQSSPDPTPMQCQLIRWAVAQYGFAAARQHGEELTTCPSEIRNAHLGYSHEGCEYESARCECSSRLALVHS